MIVKVTKKDISRGIPCDHSRCPIARAIRRTTGIRTVTVGPTMYQYTDKGRTYDLPRVAREAIYIIDHGNRVVLEPFSFQIRKPA